MQPYRSLPEPAIQCHRSIVSIPAGEVLIQPLKVQCVNICLIQMISILLKAEHIVHNKHKLKCKFALNNKSNVVFV